LPERVSPLSARPAAPAERGQASQPAPSAHPSQPAQWQDADRNLRRIPAAPAFEQTPRIARRDEAFWSTTSEPASPLLETSSAPPEMSRPSSTPAWSTGREREWAAIENRATAQVQQAFSLAERGAHYTARVELIRSLRSVAHSLDSLEGTRRHADSLAAGLRALEERAEFQPSIGQIAEPVNLEGLIAVHRTPVLKPALNRGEARYLTPHDAMRAYDNYAQEQLGGAVSRGRAGSLALYALGKLHAVLEQAEGGGSQALVFHQAAMRADPENYLAANEVGVLLARREQWEGARRVLHHGVNVCPTVEGWHNLAVVYERLGDLDMASRARREVQQLSQRAPAPAGLVDRSPVQWMAPEEFAKTARPDPSAIALPSHKLTPSAPPAASATTAGGNPKRRTSSMRATAR
jgi:tetratricopeptide (TPR) repeat protein